MLVNFKKAKAGMLNVPLKDEKAKGLSAERQAHTTPKFVTLVPGMNDIPDAVWNKIRNNERIATYVKRGDIVLPYAETVEPTPEKKKAGAGPKELTAKEFKELKAEEQEAIIKETEQIALLKKFKKSGAKESVKAFLNDKLDRAEHPEKYADED
jgi:hypothetical protein